VEDRDRHGWPGWSSASRELALGVALLGMMLEQVEVELPVPLEFVTAFVRTIEGRIRLDFAQPEWVRLAGGMPYRHFDQYCHSVPQSAGQDVHPTDPFSARDNDSAFSGGTGLRDECHRGLAI
jgi:hypothetical protein